MCSNIGTPNNHHFPFGTNGKLVVLGVPILLKHFRVFLVPLYKGRGSCFCHRDIPVGLGMGMGVDMGITLKKCMTKLFL